MVKQAFAFLQEKFADLQRGRERREEKELVKHFACSNPGCLYLMFPNGSVHPEQAVPLAQHQVNCHQYLARKSSGGSFLSLGSISECNQGEFGGVSLRAALPSNKLHRATGNVNSSRFRM